MNHGLVKDNLLAKSLSWENFWVLAHIPEADGCEMQAHTRVTGSSLWNECQGLSLRTYGEWRMRIRYVVEGDVEELADALGQTSEPRR